MLKYSQPDFYKFSQDSTRLANLVSETSPEGSLLDLCCGSGVIGIEVSRSSQIDSIVLVEKQLDFIPIIEENLAKFIPNLKSEVILADISNWSYMGEFETIVMNPPYFSKSKSRRSHDERKDTCRSYKDGLIAKLVLKGLGLLSATGSFYMVLRDNEAMAEVKSAIGESYEYTELNRDKEILFVRIRHLNIN